MFRRRGRLIIPVGDDMATQSFSDTGVTTFDIDLATDFPNVDILHLYCVVSNLSQDRTPVMQWDMGSGIVTTGYHWSHGFEASNNATPGDVAANTSVEQSDTHILLSGGALDSADADSSFHGIATLMLPRETGLVKHVNFQSSNTEALGPGTGMVWTNGAGTLDNTNPIDTVRFLLGGAGTMDISVTAVSFTS